MAEQERSNADYIEHILTAQNEHAILNVNENASKDDIKRAFLKLSLKIHPDKNDGSDKATRAFKKLNNAYQRLHNGEISDDENIAEPDENFNEEQFLYEWYQRQYEEMEERLRRQMEQQMAEEYLERPWIIKQDQNFAIFWLLVFAVGLVIAFYVGIPHIGTNKKAPTSSTTNTTSVIDIEKDLKFFQLANQKALFQQCKKHKEVDKIACIILFVPMEKNCDDLCRAQIFFTLRAVKNNVKKELAGYDTIGWLWSEFKMQSDLEEKLKIESYDNYIRTASGSNTNTKITMVVASWKNGRVWSQMADLSDWQWGIDYDKESSTYKAFLKLKTKFIVKCLSNQLDADRRRIDGWPDFPKIKKLTGKALFNRVVLDD